MSGLVGYGSSDEDSENEPTKTEDLKPSAPLQYERNDLAEVSASNDGNTTSLDTPMPDAPDHSTNDRRLGLGGPAVESSLDQGGDVEEGAASPVSQLSQMDSSAALRSLTLPSVPNLDIPPSPPGSPPTTMSQKVAQFLELKKKGTHFNEKLARSSAMKNPSLLGKLMTFAGLEPDEQYATTLPSELWDPSGFPSWAYKDELAKAQQEAQKEREEERAKSGRTAADFITASGSEHSSRSGTPGGKGARSSAAERVIAGLSRDRDRTESRREGSHRRRSRSPGRR